MTTSTNEVGKLDVMADSVPVSPVVIPQWIERGLSQVVATGMPALFYDGYKVCNNERINNWLTIHLGLTTDDNWHVLKDGAFTVNFDWRAQVWVIRA